MSETEKKNEKKKRPKNLRKSKTPIDGDDNDDIKSNIEEVKLLQKMRARNYGLSLSADAHGVSQAAVVASDKISNDGDPNNNNNSNEEWSTKSTDNKVGLNSFQQEISDSVNIDMHMEKYITEELERRRKSNQINPNKKEEESEKQSDTTSNNNNNNNNNNSTDENIREEDLYKMKSHQPPVAKTAQNEEEQESGERWLTGITEVALPIQYKLKNIEETEIAKRELLTKQANKTGHASLPSNYSVNFKQHKKEFDQNKRSFVPKTMDNNEERKPRKNKNADDNIAHASDDRVVDRFIKRFKWK